MALAYAFLRRAPELSMVVRAPYLAAASAALIGTLVVALLSGISDPAIAVPTWLVSAAVASAAMRPRHTDQLAPS